MFGYPSRQESPHDLVENSQPSTALSYADGLAKGLQLSGADRRVVEVISDGALTGGMYWEALNNIGQTGRPIVVVLNDNGRSHAPTTGGALATTAVEAATILCAHTMKAAVADPQWIVPVDSALNRAAARYRLVATIEGNAASGGFGEVFARSPRSCGLTTTMLTLALPDGLAPAAERGAMHRQCGLDAESIAKQVDSALSRITGSEKSRRRGRLGEPTLTGSGPTRLVAR
jgi:deoxyxylulose-5-phosphate synthase